MVAGRLKNCIRCADLAFRIGTDESVPIGEGTDASFFGDKIGR